MKVAVKYKKDNCIFECEELQVCEDFRHYINIDNCQYRIKSHEWLKDAVADERIEVNDRDYVVFCFDTLKYCLGPFKSDNSLITKDIVEEINSVIYRQFNSEDLLIKIDLEDVLDNIKEFKENYSHGDINFTREWSDTL